MKDPRVVVGGGIALALAAGVAVAFFLGAGRHEAQAPAPASQGGLVVEVGREDVKLDPNRKLPCYVSGQSVGMTTHAECASRNGITSGQLDVGIDPSGAMAFGETGATLTPLPPEPVPVAAVPTVTPVATPVAPAAPQALTMTCWRYADRIWVRVGDMPVGACVTTLFDGHCERPGAATYGRWGEQTLRLVPGKIETSSDNRSFRTLAEQGSNCSIPAL